MALLAASGVSAGYHGKAVIDRIDLTVAPGDFVVLLGANGSGKSTLMRALSGQIALLAGAVAIGGVDLASSPEQAKRGLGYAVEPQHLPDALTGAQYLELIASIRRCGTREFPGGDLVALVQIERWLREPILGYSLGTRMKLSILGALLGAPKLIMLDESLNGLDPLILALIRRVLAGLCAAGHGVILSTHMLGTIGDPCSEILFLESGRATHRWDRASVSAAQRSTGGLEAMVIAALESTAAPLAT
ncbi:ATP-binding cassette domain-containing protein [Acidiphilium sp.]|uniref:ATP-binding cassette domain-containing protein n=1 Tax=Acidiphilium sp. TaxID=527 RepID=UPI003D07207A